MTQANSSKTVTAPPMAPEDTYVGLCQKLALTRDFRYGDEYELWDDFDYEGRQGWHAVYGTGCNSCVTDDEASSADPWHIWLPTLLDWLGMLEMALEPFPKDYDRKSYVLQQLADNALGARSYEENAARFWMELMDKRNTP